jgi:hypothetical protein
LSAVEKCSEAAEELLECDPEFGVELEVEKEEDAEKRVSPDSQYIVQKTNNSMLM